MRFQLPFLLKKQPPSPIKASLHHTSEPSEGSSSASSQRSAGPPSPVGGKDGVHTEGKASSRNKHANVTLFSERSSSFRIRELQDAFNVFDANHDGQISVEELGSVLRSLGENPSEQELMQMVRDVDRDGDGYINLDEFLFLHSASEGNWMNCDKELREAFRFFDADKNGFISVEELHNVLKRLRRNCSLEECRKMIRGVDEDGDGQVSFEEFQKMMA